MRLREQEVAAIREEVARLDDRAQVWLFGSRVRDDQKGGDIDLVIRSDRIRLAERVELKVRLQDRLGGMPLDLVVSPASASAPAWVEAAINEGIPL